MVSLLSSDRHWYHPRSDTFYTLPFGQTNHSLDVSENPQKYGLQPEEVPELRNRDYDENILFTAMKKGWVRIRIDRRQPDLNNNIEGTSWSGLRKAAELLATEMRSMQRLIVVLRTGPSDKQGDAYVLDQPAIDFFIRKGRPPHKSKVTVESAVEEIKMAIHISEVQRLAGVDRR